MKKSMFALACATSVAAFADTIDNTVGFEDYTTVPFTDGVSYKDDTGGSTGSYYWLYVAASSSTDGSEVKAYETPPTYSGVTFGDNYLELSTEGGTLWRSVAPLASEALNDGTAVPEDGLYIDTMVQFTPTEDGGTPELAAADKLAIWLNVDSDTGATNLCVRANAYDMDGLPRPTATTFTLVNADGTVPTVNAGAWYRLTVKAHQNVLLALSGYFLPVFQVYLDGAELKASSCPFTEAMLTAMGSMATESMATLASTGKLLPSLQEMQSTAENVTLSAVGFKGSGAIDNLSIKEVNPLPSALEFTITAPEAAKKTEWSTDGTTWTEYASGASAVAGTLYIRLTNADGAKKIVTVTLSSDSKAFDESAETFGWPEYLGAAAEDGSYGVDTADELAMLQKGMAAGLATAGVTFKQTADIALSGEWTGIGAFDAKDQLDKSATYTAGAFQGTYDGDNHTISNVILQRGDYVGFFGSTYGATIKNLKISLGSATGFGTTSTSTETATNYGGAAFVGVSVNTTIENCQTLKTDTYTTLKGSKAIGGIVGYAAKGTTVKGCVNNLNLETANEKCGGMMSIAQNTGNWSFADVVIDSCTNNGNLYCSTASKMRVGGLCSYSDIKVVFKGANVVTGTLSQNSGSAYSVASPNSGSVELAEGATFTVPAANMTINSGKGVDGLFFATVADGVATLVKNDAIAAGGSFKVMAADAPAVVLPNVGDSLDVSLVTSYTTVTTTATDAYVAKDGNVYTVTAKTAPALAVTVDPEIAEYTDTLTLPTPVVTGATDYTTTWDPATITEPTAGTTNTYTVTVSVAATDTTLAATATATFKVYKAVAYPTYIGDDTAKQAKYDVWAKTYGADTASAYENAYLLNCAPADAATEAAAFKITAITVNADGTVTVTTPTGKSYNGTVEVKGATTVNGTYNLPTTDTTARFFKAFLK